MNLIKCIDNQKGMREIPDESVNLVVTSPPYNVGAEKHNPIKYGTHVDEMRPLEYWWWMKDVFQAVWHRLTPDGRVVINIGSKKNGRDPAHYFMMKIMRKIGYGFYTTIIWDKGHTSRNSAFGSYLKPSCPSFVTTFEYILIFYKETRKLNPKYHLTTETDLIKDEFVEWARAIWKFPGVKNDIHPAAFPLTLPWRAIKMLSYKGDTVLDPFCGIGTTCAAAKVLDRKYIGFDIDFEYIERALYWIENLDKTESTTDMISQEIGGR